MEEGSKCFDFSSRIEATVGLASLSEESPLMFDLKWF
jgi:hypothetical protein